MNLPKLKLKGGSWGYDPWFCRSASRILADPNYPDYQNYVIGFRLFFTKINTNTNMKTPILSIPFLSTVRAVFKPGDNNREMAMATTPVTQAQWRKVVAQFPDCGLKTNPSYFPGAHNPVERVSYEEIQKWIGLLNQLLEQECCEYRACLPTEEIWEEFANAGRDCLYPTGDSITSEMANYDNHYNGTTPVRSFPPNPWGLYDMAGNVFEFVDEKLPDFNTFTQSLEIQVKKLQEELETVKKRLVEAGK